MGLQGSQGNILGCLVPIMGIGGPKPQASESAEPKKSKYKMYMYTVYMHTVYMHVCTCTQRLFCRNGRWRSEWTLSFSPGSSAELKGVLRVQVCVCMCNTCTCTYMYMYMYLHVHVHVYTLAIICRTFPPPMSTQLLLVTFSQLYTHAHIHHPSIRKLLGAVGITWQEWYRQS